MSAFSPARTTREGRQAAARYPTHGEAAAEQKRTGLRGTEENSMSRFFVASPSDSSVNLSCRTVEMRANLRSFEQFLRHILAGLSGCAIDPFVQHRNNVGTQLVLQAGWITIRKQKLSMRKTQKAFIHGAIRHRKKAIIVSVNIQ